jgi:iron complex outermembrane receptor protein
MGAHRQSCHAPRDEKDDMGIKRFRLSGFRLSMAGGAIAAAVTSLLPSQSVLAQVTSVPNTVYEFNLPGGDLAKALDAFSTQAGVQIGYAPELVAGRQAGAIRGRFGWREALGQLLQRSGLKYEQVGDGFVVLQRSSELRSTGGRHSTAASQNIAVTNGNDPVTGLESITVTGTRIRGGAAPSPVITIGVEQIQEEGFRDLGEVIRSVPQNFGGGQNPGIASGSTVGAAGLANQNITGGSSLNLRGLGPDATLTLLNGRRLSYGGFVQAVDIGAIPVEAVERVEIVADGASAIYGSDAVGGVGNVILKRGFEGASVGMRYGDSTDGGLGTREYSATVGTAWSSGGVIATYKDVSVDPIYARQRDYTELLRDPITIYTGNDLRSGLLSAYQSLGDVAELRLDAFKTERDLLYYTYYSGVTNYYNHFEPEITTTLVSPSIDLFLPGDWTLTFGGAWGKDERVQNQMRVNTATGISTLSTNDCYCNETRSYEVGAEGPLFAMPAGDARLAIGAGYRKNEFIQRNYITGTLSIAGDEGSRFAYAEVNLPLIGPDSNNTGAHRLTLTAAVRGEDYDSFGGVTTPKLGLIYSPTPDFTAKASWGRSFKAPTLFQRNYAAIAYLDLPEYFGGTAYPADATVLYIGGGNARLEPERARTWSASLAFHPEALPGLEAELTWFDIDYTDRVVEPIGSGTAQALSNPIYAEFISYSPSTEEQTAVIAAADSFDNYVGTSYDPGDVVAIIYNRYVNATRQRIKGLDLSGSYRLDLGAGWLAFRGSASYLDSTQQTTGTPDSYDLAGTLFNPAKVKGRIGAVWNQDGFSASAFANYNGGVTDTVAQEKTASLTTLDATLRYSTRQPEGIWSGLEFGLSILNLFDRAPPSYATTNSIYVPYDSTNYSAIGRFWSLSVSKHF